MTTEWKDTEYPHVWGVATLTIAGAKRIGYPELTGSPVIFARIIESIETYEDGTTRTHYSIHNIVGESGETLARNLSIDVPEDYELLPRGYFSCLTPIYIFWDFINEKKGCAPFTPPPSWNITPNTPPFDEYIKMTPRFS